MREELWIPHLSKVPSSTLPAGADLSDPPLSPKSLAAAPGLMRDLVGQSGPPAMIVVSTMKRARQTAAPAIEEFGRHYADGCLVVMLNTLAQPDSGDPAEPGDPKADSKGYIYFGARSFDPQWFQWVLASRQVITAISATLKNDGPVWVFTHRPIVAAARWVVRNGLVVPEVGQIDSLDTTLLPWITIQEQDGRLVELAK